MASPTRRSPRRPGSRSRRPRCGCTGAASGSGICSTVATTSGGPSMQCEEIAELLPDAVDANQAVPLSVQEHIESCLRCQAELARYRRMLRGLQHLRTQYLEPTPGLLTATLAAIEEASERRAIRSVLTGKRLAYAGAIGGALAAAGATAAAVVAHRARRRALVAH